ncbi:amidohydrolase [Alkalibacter mobilis]|uniref:amidohydrolase n=1 Tax=Alkalibacter mobilis TaxID=2787712 RepID=UPI0018A02838|nr:amidohydrolase [Alkalibacter mobilis]MBF7097470.1 amidohydrolase [Alkalibacter mobilis]
MLMVKADIIYTVSGDPINNGMMLVDDRGKIEDIGVDLTVSENCEVLDISDKVIIPGLIDAHTHVGMWGDGEGRDSYDGNEYLRPITGEVRAIDGVNPMQVSFEGAREGGITTVQILPGSGNPIGGLGFACKTWGKVIDDMIIKDPTGLKGAMGENPKRTHGKGFGHTPISRMGVASMIRDYFEQAKEYGKKKNLANQKGEIFDLDLNLESGWMALERKIPFRIHAHRHDDILTAVRICEEFGLDYSIEHCTDGHLIGDHLGSKKITAMVGPGLSPSTKVETANFTDANPALLAEKGVNVCLITDHPFLNCRYFLTYGAVAHKYGFPFDETLRAMTLNPAKAIGIEERVGSLERGKDADFVVLSGKPFKYKSVIESTFIEGKQVWKRDII